VNKNVADGAVVADLQITNNARLTDYSAKTQSHTDGGL